MEGDLWRDIEITVFVVMEMVHRILIVVCSVVHMRLGKLLNLYF